MKNFYSAIFILVFGIFTQQAHAGSNILPAPQKVGKHSYAWIGPLPGPSKANQGFRCTG